MVDPLLPIVHYVSYGTPGGEYPSLCRVAIVTEDREDDTLSLCVVNPTGLFFNPAIPHHPGGLVGGSWHHLDQCPGRT